jgi:rhamnosyltransferase
MESGYSPIGIFIPTRNNADTIEKCLRQLNRQDIEQKILIIDSSSTDHTVTIARDLGAEVRIIPPIKFNHGATREEGRKLLKTLIVVMLTADAIVQDDHTVKKLITPIMDGQAAVSYARQIPRKNADVFESVPRLFNYPPESQLRGMEDIPKYGVYTFFCSNSCAAYRNDVLDETGGFDSVLTNEDYFAVARILRNGYRIAYAADAVVEHSHNYSLSQDFKRYFDTGYVRAERNWVIQLVGQAEGRGMQLFKKTLKELKKQNKFLLPKAFFVFFARWIGFRLGYLAIHTPGRINRYFSAQSLYWKSEYYLHKR